MTPGLLIFDCDGVLVDSEPIANRVLAERLNASGLRMSPDEVMRRFVGRSKAGCLDLATELLGHALPETFASDWDRALFAALGNEVRAIDGVRELVARLGMHYCVASNSSPERMRVSLTASGLLPLFEGRMFSAAQVARPKPAPDLFLHAAHTLGVAPSRCVVVEDTPTGVRAAVAAGMTVYGFTGSGTSTSALLKTEGARPFSHMGELADLLTGVV